MAFAGGGEQDRAAYLDLADRCARHVWQYLHSYGGAGSWREGVTYWGYGTGLASRFHFEGEPTLAGKTLTIRAGDCSLQVTVEADTEVALSLGKHEDLIPYIGESRTPITIPHLTVDVTVRPPGVELRYTFTVREGRD